MSPDLLTSDPPVFALYFKSHLSRREMLRNHLKVRKFSLYLTEPLETEDYVIQSMQNASPTKWHLAHTTWFFETFILSEWLRDYRSRHPKYAFLFNSYYVQAGDRYPRPQRGLISRPTVRDVMDYRRDIDALMETLIGEISSDHLPQLSGLIEIGLNHEQQHQELILTDLKHMLSANPLFPVYRESQVATDSQLPKLQWVEFEAGLREIGQDGSSFCYDNEMPRHPVYQLPFAIANRPVSNGEYLEFMSDGGYRRPELWLDEGWQRAQSEGWQAPLYWQQRDSHWYSFTLSGLQPLNQDDPVCHVSHFEADAFARWAEARLPTEIEWEIAASGQPVEGNFVDQGNFHPVCAKPAEGHLHQLFGDVWEWTQSAYLPYPGYRPLPGALGEYNGKFMSNQMVLRGGSCATSRDHIRPSYRNFFHSSCRWQFSGIRLARDISG